MSVKEYDIYKKKLENIKSFGKITIRDDINEKYFIDNNLLTDTELAWRRILLSATKEQTPIIWDAILNPKKYGFFNRELNKVEKSKMQRMLCKIDRVYLSQVLAGNDPNHNFRKILHHEWVYSRCREVERDSESYLELWPRSHFKSVLCNQIEIIQDHLINPKLTIIVITYSVSFAQDVYDYVKKVYSTNIHLKRLFPEIFYKEPDKEAPVGEWNSTNLWLKPNSGVNSREPSLTFCSVINLKTGRHFQKRIYDDVINEKSVTSMKMIEKINKGISDSKNIGNPGGKINIEHFVGTRYHKNDSYQWLIDNKLVTTRIYKATTNGKMSGKPVLLTEEEWEEKKKEHSYVVACQMLMEPSLSEDSIFNVSYLKSYNVVRPMDVFILVDPASSKKIDSDNTAISVIGIDPNQNKFLLDGVRDKIDLEETWQKLKDLHRKWNNFLPVTGYNLTVLYEKFGSQRDDEALKLLMERDGYFFDIETVSFGNGTKRSKKDRVMRLIPDFKRGKFYIPQYVFKNGKTWKWKLLYDKENDHNYLSYEEIELKESESLFVTSSYTTNEVRPLLRKNYEGEDYDYTVEFIEEMESFPYGKYDDIIDACSRIYDVPDLSQLIQSVPRNNYKKDYIY